MINQKQNEEKGGVNPIVAVVAGVAAATVVGAGIAVALSDKKNREKAKAVLTNARDKAIGYIENMQKQAEDKKVEVEEKLAEGKEKVKKLTN